MFAIMHTYYDRTRHPFILVDVDERPGPDSDWNRTVHIDRLRHLDGRPLSGSEPLACDTCGKHGLTFRDLMPSRWDQIEG